MTPRRTARQAARLTSSPEGLLVIVGLASIATYVWFWTRPFWVFNYDLEARAIAVGHALGLNYRSVAQYSVSFTLPLLLHLAALVTARSASGPAATRIAIAGAVLLPLSLVLAYPVLAADVFDYLMFGRMIAAYVDNPYVHVAAQYPEDPYRHAVGWPGLPSVYGPLFNYLVALPVRLAGGNVLLSLIYFKLIVLAAHGANTALVYGIARRLKPGSETLAAIAYGWSPLSVVFAGVDGHNDALMLLPLAAAVWLALDERHDLALVGVTVGVLVKFVPVVLFPVFLLAAWRFPRRAAIGLAVSALLAAAAFGPLWAGVGTFDGIRDQNGRQISSLATLLTHALDSKGAARAIMYGAFAIGYVAALVAFRDVVGRCFGVMTVYVATAVFWLKGWYVAWPLLFGSILGEPAIVVTYAWSFGPFIVHIFEAWGWLMNWWSWQERWGGWMMNLWLTSSMMVPLAIGLVAAAAMQLRRRRAAGRQRLTADC